MAGICDLDLLCSLLDEDDEDIEEGATALSTASVPTCSVETNSNNAMISKSPTCNSSFETSNVIVANTIVVNPPLKSVAVSKNDSKPANNAKGKVAATLNNNSGPNNRKTMAVCAGQNTRKGEIATVPVLSSGCQNANLNPAVESENVPNIAAIQAELKAMQERMMLLQQQLEAQTQATVIKNDPPPVSKTLKDVSLPWMENENVSKQKKSTVKETVPKRSSPKTMETSKQATHKATVTPKQKVEVDSYRNDDLSSSEEEAERYPLENKGLNEFGVAVKKRMSHQPKYDSLEFKRKQTWSTQKKLNQSTLLGIMPKVEKKGNDDTTGGNVQAEFYSGLRIVNPTISSASMKEKMTGKKMIRLSVMQQFMRNGDIEGDWVTIGVIVSKSEPRTSANGKNFTIWRLCDLRDCSQIVSFFLFGKVHLEHWKTPVGTVIGLLNPSIMPSRESNSTEGKEISLNVDHPQKVMFMGKAKDLGTCRGKRKDGNNCSMIVNVDVCEYCPFHIQAAYKKVSSKRMDLQSSFSGPEPKGLRQKILKNQEIFYGGQSFTSSPNPNGANKKRASKQLILDSLKLQKKAELVKQEALATPLGPSGKPSVPIAHVTSSAIEDMLAIPSAGSRNLVKHLTKEMEAEEKKGQPNFSSITAKDLLKLHAQEVKAKRTASATFSKKVSLKGVRALPKLSLPALGSGLSEGQDIVFDTVPAKLPAVSPRKIKKLKAAAKVNKAGPLKKINPNAVKKVKSPDMVERVKKRLKQSGIEPEGENEPDTKRPCVGVEKIDFEKHKDIINRKSMYDDALTIEQLEKQEKYFNALEKKENMETYMSGITEMQCDVVSCKKCRYTAFSAAERCKEQHHDLVYHKGKKRFFSCQNCKQRTISLNKLPTRACRNCGSSSYERVGMWKERTGPKLASETLSLRGDEVKNLSSMVVKNTNLNL